MNIESRLLRHQDISTFSGYKTKAETSYLYRIQSPEDVENLHLVCAYVRDRKLPFFILGRGMNCLFAFDEFPGVIVENTLDSWSYDPSLKILSTYSNARIWDIAESLEVTFEQPIWHRFIGLPGSVGGAIYGNAGCFGLETAHNFLSAKILRLSTGEKRTFSHDEMEFSYRFSFLKKSNDYFLIDSLFDLSEVREKYHSDVDVYDFRENKQPKGNTCGSFFKNPSRECTAGMLIEEVGLKGKRLDGAYFSDLHANFLMSDGANCSWRDLLSLVELAEKTILEKKGVRLEREVQVIHPEDYVPV